MRSLVRCMVSLFVCIAIGTQAFANCDNMNGLPLNGATVTPNQAETVVLKWSAQVAAAEYDVYFGPAGACSVAPRATVQAPDTEWSPPSNEITPGTAYEWKVIAKGPGLVGCGTPPTTGCLSFTTASCPAAPPLLSPANNSVEDFGVVTFMWDDVPGATSYDLYVGLDGDPLSLKATTAGLSKAGGIDPGRTVEWKVVANAPSCPGSASAHHFFTTSCPSTPPSQNIPASGATFAPGQNINFSWTHVPGAAGYDVKISNDGGNSWQVIGENLDNNFFTIDAFAPGSYLWEVRANFNGDCDPLYSEPRPLFVSADCSGNDAPELISPAAGATLQKPVTFKWSAVANAEEYQLFVQGAGDAAPRLIANTSGTEWVTSDLQPGLNNWTVRAVFAECPPIAAAPRTLRIEQPVDCGQAVLIALLLPAQNATTTSPVHMSWSPVANASFYRVWVSVNGGAPVNILRTTATEADVRLPAGSMRWYVDAPRPGCDTVVSPEGQFTVSQGANCASNVGPALISPVGTRENPANAASPVTLSWSPIANAIGYRVWISRNLTSFEDVTLTKETQVTLPREPGLYAWFAEAFFEGCAPKPSATAFFRVADAGCPTAAPATIAPAQGSVITSPFTFVWTAVPGAVKYRVIASLDDSEPQLIGVTDQTQLTRTLPPGSIAWRVEAVFDRCASTFSGRASFTIQQSSECSDIGAQPVSPADGANNVASPVNFTWTPVTGAIKYVLVARVNEGSPTPLASTTDTSVTHEMPPGLIRWHVVTFFAGCDPFRSQELRFTIARPQDCENRRPILLLPTDDNRPLPSPVQFQWTAVPNATSYLLWARMGADDPSVIATTSEPAAEVDLARGRYEYFVEARFDGCASTRSARGEFVVTPAVPCGTPLRPDAQVVGQALSNTKYRLRWTPLPNVELYEVQESTSPDFSNATTSTTRVPVMQFMHEVNGAPVKYLYRVRGVSNCGNGDRGPYSDTVSVVVTAPTTPNGSAEIGAEDVIVQKVTLPGSTEPVPFTATSDKPWITVTPSSGSLTADTTELTVTADPAFLPLGTNTGTIGILYGASGSRSPRTEATTFKIPVSISLVTPVVPAGKASPPPDSLIFPVVGHAGGANNSLFESDIRVTNLTAETARYELHFTPSNTDGTQTGSTSTIEIAPNATMALDDIVASLFGLGTSSVTGMLEVRPLTTTSSASTGFFGSTNLAGTIRDLTTAAASRTYNFTPDGTFGQFIPAVRFEDFVGKSASGVPPSILSLQQVAQSAAYRANFGFAEASGAPADLKVRVYDTTNNLLKTIDLSLQAGEHRQLNGMLATNGITDLADGRVEVEVVGGEGKVTAYVSAVDNRTNDPLLVSAVLKGAVTANKYVVPGVAYLNNVNAFWVTDLRIFNAGTTATPATVTFYPERNPGASISKQIALEPGEIEVLDNVVNGLFEQTDNKGGSVAVTTPAETQLTVTARTYNQKTPQGGTYGQYIPGVTPAQSVGRGDRALQLLQLEQSSRFRTNIGLNETAGQPVTLEVSAIVPDLIVTPVVSVTLQPNEFQQISLGSFGLTDAYNTRVTVKVVAGEGRVTAYGSAIDAITQDPTYVPAQ